MPNMLSKRLPVEGYDVTVAAESSKEKGPLLCNANVAWGGTRQRELVPAGEREGEVVQRIKRA